MKKQCIVLLLCCAVLPLQPAATMMPSAWQNMGESWQANKDQRAAAYIAAGGLGLGLAGWTAQYLLRKKVSKRVRAWIQLMSGVSSGVGSAGLMYYLGQRPWRDNSRLTEANYQDIATAIGQPSYRPLPSNDQHGQHLQLIEIASTSPLAAQRVISQLLPFHDARGVDSWKWHALRKLGMANEHAAPRVVTLLSEVMSVDGLDQRYKDAVYPALANIAQVQPGVHDQVLGILIGAFTGEFNNDQKIAAALNKIVMGDAHAVGSLPFAEKMLTALTPFLAQNVGRPKNQFALSSLYQAPEKYPALARRILPLLRPLLTADVAQIVSGDARNMLISIFGAGVSPRPTINDFLAQLQDATTPATTKGKLVAALTKIITTDDIGIDADIVASITTALSDIFFAGSIDFDLQKNLTTIAQKYRSSAEAIVRKIRGATDAVKNRRDCIVLFGKIAVAHPEIAERGVLYLRERTSNTAMDSRNMDMVATYLSKIGIAHPGFAQAVTTTLIQQFNARHPGALPALANVAIADQTGDRVVAHEILGALTPMLTRDIGCYGYRRDHKSYLVINLEAIRDAQPDFAQMINAALSAR